MSHNVEIKGVKITDISVVERALAELNRENGTHFYVDKSEKATMRGWRGARNRADVVICNPDGQYDIGLNKQADGSYNMIAENLGGHDFGEHLGTEEGAMTIEGKVCDVRDKWGNLSAQGMTGRLVQMINVVTAEDAAASQGYMVERTKGEDGIIELVATVD